MLEKGKKGEMLLAGDRREVSELAGVGSGSMMLPGVSMLSMKEKRRGGEW